MFRVKLRLRKYSHCRASAWQIRLSYGRYGFLIKHTEPSAAVTAILIGLISQPGVQIRLPYSVPIRDVRRRHCVGGGAAGNFGWRRRGGGGRRQKRRCGGGGGRVFWVGGGGAPRVKKNRRRRRRGAAWAAKNSFF